ncbi:hypothetical protein IPG41_05030 [Candidatus Peregrinibacteria bacterium]|nr:MAG: hypothetical protein IPG41_05030 [Candidatus Peregrinibacteria bacterium]
MKLRALLFGFLLFSSCGAPSGAVATIQAGGEWFLNNQNESFIHYQYSPKTFFHPEKSHSMREMGALWSIYHLADFLEDERYEVLAERGLHYFKSSLVQDEENGFTYVNITPEKVKLGYSAFMILNLLESEDPEKEELMRELADGILYAQAENGELDTFFYSDRATGVDYYPGEALLALMSLYEHTGEPRYLEAVSKALPYYEAYFKENPNTAFVPWQTQAFFKYYENTEEQAAADFIFAMNDFMVQKFSEGQCDPNLNSAGIVAAVFSEGMNKAYELAERVGDEERSRCYARFIRNGAEKVMELQFPMEDQNAEDFEAAAWGGFYGSKGDWLMQVDRNQHAVMALMGAYELGLIQ